MSTSTGKCVSLRRVPENVLAGDRLDAFNDPSSGETRALPLSSSISNGANSMVVLTISVLRLQQEVLRCASYSKNS